MTDSESYLLYIIYGEKTHYSEIQPVPLSVFAFHTEIELSTAIYTSTAQNKKKKIHILQNIKKTVLPYHHNCFISRQDSSDK